MGVVQVLTAHAAKGLEWDYVAVPNLVEGEFPQKPKSAKGWFTAGVLPYELRGDKESLPEIDLGRALKPADFGRAKDAFADDLKVYLEREERRLAYVAFTRPKRELYLTGSMWKHSGGARTISRYVTELLELEDKRISVIGSTDWQPPVYESTRNPLVAKSATQTWPADPLGEAHRIRLTEAAGFAERQIVELGESVDSAVSMSAPLALINSEIDSLVLEADLAAETSRRVRLPVRIPASSFKDFVKDANKVAERFRRPMPSKPYVATMTGTLFHGWVEQRFGMVSTIEKIDSVDLLDEQEPEITNADLETLKEIFETSRFANRKPREVETEIQVTIDQNTFICKIDAVFDVEANDDQLAGKTIEIVDWKTGEPPTSEAEIAERSLQLALYRMAYSRRHGIPEEQISVCLYYVAQNQVLRPPVLSEAELIDLWRGVLAKLGD
jgi:DNA helicase-2/ATP-dependent DNA helicase PcrA